MNVDQYNKMREKLDGKVDFTRKAQYKMTRQMGNGTVVATVGFDGGDNDFIDRVFINQQLADAFLAAFEDEKEEDDK